MFINYLKIAVRNLFRYKFYTAINILGLSFGLAISIIIGSWIWQTLNHDAFNENYSRIYMVYEAQAYNGRDTFYTTATPGPLASKLQEINPDIEKAAVLSNVWQKYPVQYNDLVFMENNIICAQPTFFDIFSFNFIQGQKVQALTAPNTVVISEKAARKYFGDENPLNKVFKVNKDYEAQVAGVFAEQPDDAMYDVDFIFPFSDVTNFSNAMVEDWAYNSFRTYALLKPGASPENVSKAIGDVVKQNNEGSVVTLHLQSLRDMTLYNLDGSELKMQYIRIFGVIAIFIILIACINFMNISTARSALRAREVGLRKVAGARKAQLVAQFYVESYLTVLIALVFALAMTSMLIFFFNQRSGFSMQNPFSNPLFFPAVIGFIVIIGGIAGLYPAIALSSYRPVVTLKGARIGSSKSFLRKLLVVLQFALSIGLIISTLVIYNQSRYLQNKDLGYDKENVIIVELPRGKVELVELMRDKLKDDPGVVAVSSGSETPSNIGSSTSSVDWEGKSPDETFLINTAFPDYDYFKTFGIKLVLGEEIPFEKGVEDAHFVINESMAKLMPYENPIGQQITLWGMKGPVVGVCEDFIFHGFGNEIEPALFWRYPTTFNKLFVRLGPGDQGDAIERIEKHWNEISPDYPFEMMYFDEHLNYYFRQTINIGWLFLTFTILAVVISCMGLFGLASFMTMQRTKEIGIRKTLGASIGNVIVLLGLDFIRWVVIGNVIAIPLAWLAMRKWLMNYAFHTDISVWIFILASLMSILIALSTVAYQSIMVARMNPSKTLMYE